MNSRDSKRRNALRSQHSAHRHQRHGQRQHAQVARVLGLTTLIVNRRSDMSNAEIYEVETTVGRWLGRALAVCAIAVCAIVGIVFWIGGAL